jgi:hypothetical protein
MVTGALVVALTIVRACCLVRMRARAGTASLSIRRQAQGHGRDHQRPARNTRIICRCGAEGEIFLRGPVDSLHLPTGRLSSLVFKFRTSSLLSGGTAGVTSYATLIRPREGYRYEATVTYESSLFTIDILEIGLQGASSRKLPRQDITACQLA